MTLTTLIFLCFFTTISGQYYYQYSACRDLVVNCQTLRAYRWCSSYVNYMRKNCGRTCGFCRPVVKPSCIDRHRFCLSWKNKGECRRNPGYMKQYCQRSCGFCQTPKDGKWSSWGVWSKCSVSCGGGRQVRYRQCNKPAPANGGKKCAGSPKQTRSCNNDKCAIATDGKWSTWSNWSKCSKSCGGGRQYRSRQCDNPAPVNGGIPCSGRNRETRSCNDNKCAAVVDGNWSSWRPWSKCSATCGGGTQVRYRQCDSPPPQNGGMDCPGSNKDSRICNTNKCATAVDGQWGPWSQTSCSVTCGTGTNTRLRRCDSPSPSNGGKDCIGASTERKPCTKGVCPIVIDGNWGTWGVWSECSRTCNGGIKTRYRNCDNPSPTMGGQYCRGQDKEQLACNTQRCKAKARLPPFICGKSLSSRIVGGSLTKPSDWPWQAGLKRGNEKTIFCGGSIINREWVVTAAHCIYRMEPSRTGCVAPQPRLRVVLGEFDVKNVEGHEVTVDVAQVCMHPRYDHRTLDYDIALLRLSDPIMAFTQHVKPVCLPPSDYVLPIGQNCTVTGFGRVGENDKLATKLRQAAVPLKHLSYCKTQYPLKVVSHRMICAGYEDGQIDSCKGDSGGPFVCKDTYNYVLAGAVSWGVGCARPGQPGLYTNIPYFLPWLRTTMKQN